MLLGVLAVATYHEVALDKLQLVRKALLLRVPGGTINLVVVVVETSDVGTRELADLAGRATNTATNIKNIHVVPQAHDVSEVVLVTGKSLLEGLAVGEAAEME